MCELYRTQIAEGRYFLHEHPECATSWGEDCIKNLLQMDSVDQVVGDQCQYGQEYQGEPVRKPTTWMSNAETYYKTWENRAKAAEERARGNKAGITAAAPEK